MTKNLFWHVVVPVLILETGIMTTITLGLLSQTPEGAGAAFAGIMVFFGSKFWFVLDIRKIKSAKDDVSRLRGYQSMMRGITYLAPSLVISGLYGLIRSGGLKFDLIPADISAILGGALALIAVIIVKEWNIMLDPEINAAEFFRNTHKISRR